MPPVFEAMIGLMTPQGFANGHSLAGADRGHALGYGQDDALHGENSRDAGDDEASVSRPLPPAPASDDAQSHARYAGAGSKMNSHARIHARANACPDA